MLVIEEPDRLSAEVWQALRMAGARTFDVSEGQHPDAVALERLRAAARSANLECAEQVLREVGLPLALDHPKILDGWVAAPPDDIDNYPALRWTLIAIAVRRRRRVPPALLHAPWNDRDRRRPAVDRALARGLRCAVERRLARSGGVTTAVSLDSMLHDLGQGDRAALAAWLPALYAECGMALLHDGRVFHARTVFERGLETATGAWWQAALGAAAALTDILLGNVHAATRRRSACPAPDRGAPWADLHAAVDALLALEQGRLDAAQRAITETEASGDHHDIVMLVRAIIMLTSGRSHEAAELVTAVQQSRPLSRALSEMAEAMMLLLRPSLPVATVEGSPFLAVLASAHAGVAMGDLDRMRELVARTSDAGMKATPRLRLHAAVVEFTLVRQLGSRSSLRLVAERMVELMEVDGVTWPLRLLSPADAAVFTELTGRQTPEPLLGGGFQVERLTDRERIVLTELVRGGTESEIAARLQLSVNTIKTQRRSLYRKLGVSRRDEAIAQGIAMGILAPDRDGRRGA
ncbi:LuxR C-terminal-related transcriptional regulator [uncultured Aeromicrobium sp.]|uniref:helix-turn-helix transcriptional regulator n=1 Tax=uncultured Aeromicrobium sp. TaxID=337820 RepID=UPI0025FCA252|nr:LuxR C-terminal-related transcriptional regulator [uncultured Aeromicrobium sp.]